MVATDGDPDSEDRKKDRGHERNEKSNNNRNNLWPKMPGFLFETIYELVTWVLIATSIACIFYFLGKTDMRGVFWSAVVLGIFIVIMICLVADRHFFQGHKSHPMGERPNIVVSSATCDLEAMKTSEDARLIHIAFENVGNGDASDFSPISTAFLTSEELTDSSKVPALNIDRTPSTQLVPSRTRPSQTLDVKPMISSVEIVNRIQAGKLFLYVWGRFTWKDKGVDPPIEYTRNFCGIYAPNTRTFQTAPFLND